MSTSKSVEDEFFELLNSPDPQIPTKTVDVEGIASSAFALTTSSYEDSQDFLSWLDDTATPSKAPEIKLKEGSLLNESDFNLLSTLEETMKSSANTAGQTSSAVPEAVDTGLSVDLESSVSKALESIYDEMFGTTDLNKPIPDSFDTTTFKPKQNSVEYELEMDKILSSPFPDVGRLRELIDKYGFIHHHQRIATLLLLLTGSCHVDEEADRFSVSASEREFHRDLVTDTQSLIASCFPPNRISSSSNIQNDLIDVVILYCQRRSIDYTNTFSRLLVSIFGDGEQQSKSLVSSCFYALMSNFLPLVGLRYTELVVATDAMHTWLRLLVTYHSPTVAQHLDRVLPGWEKKAKELTSTQSSKISSIQKANSALDSLEKELGLDLGFDDFGLEDNSTGAGVGDERSIQSAPPKSATNNGMIHSHWMTVFFSGSVPAAQSAALLDWSILNGERFAGVYFMASLFEIYGPALEQMNAPQLTQFFESISTNKSNWFATVGSALPSISNWADFTEAWIHATSALIGNTPKAFRDALLRTEAWAIIAADKQQKDLSTQMQSFKQQSKALLAMGDLENENFFETSLDDPVHGGLPVKAGGAKAHKKDNKKLSGSQTPVFDNVPNMSDAEDEDDDLMDDAEPTPLHYGNSSSHDSTNDEDDDSEDVNGEEDGECRASQNSLVEKGESSVVGDVARRASTLLMDNLRSLTAKLSATAAAASAGSMGGVDALPRGPQHFPPFPPGVDPNTERFPHDVKLGVDTSCLWSDASEIIPSICGSQRQRIASYSAENQESSGVSEKSVEEYGLIGAIFRHRVEHPTNRRCFFISSGSGQSNNNAPWYFAIDCRSAEEKQLGLFPKAYAIDQDLITDGEAMSHLLTVLAPLKNTVHIAIIGAGDAWHRFCYRQRHPRKYARSVQRPPYKEPADLQRLLEDEHNHVHAIAIFLIKRGFRFISVVDGGFVSALEALHRPDSRFSLQTSLVDSDRASVHALLGIQNTAVATSTEKTMNLPTTASAASSGGAPSSLLMSSSAAALAMSGSYSVQSQQHHQSSNTVTSSVSGSSSAASTIPHPLQSVSTTSTDNSSINTGATSLAAIGKNVSSLLSTWVTSSTASSAAHTADSPPLPSATSSTVASSETDSAPAASNGTSGATSTTTSALAGWGSSLMGKGLDTIKKGWGVTANLTAAATAASSTAASVPPAQNHKSQDQDLHVKDPSTSFIIGDHDDDDDDGHQHRQRQNTIDSHSIAITRTDQERAQALALHRLAGMKKGDFLYITRDELPGAILFPCIKMKKMSVMMKKTPADSAVIKTDSLLDLEDEQNTADAESDVMMVEQEIPVSRYLVITRERFIVLDTSASSTRTEDASEGNPIAPESPSKSKSGGVGSQAMVKSNHHLTELIKMTFKKKDPELVTLYLLSSTGEPKPRQYRVVKYKDFVATLQKNMERFKI